MTDRRRWFHLSAFTDIVSAIGIFFTTLLPINATDHSNRGTIMNPLAATSRSSSSSGSASSSTPQVFVNYAWLKNHGFPDDQAIRSLLVKYATLHLTLKKKIPAELIYKIFTFTDGFVITGEEKTVREGGMDNMNHRYLAMLLFNSPVFLPVSVEFTVVSNDQGWTSEPGPTGNHDSFSWGEAVVTTYSSPSTVSSSSQRYHVYTNRRAERRPERQVIKKDHTDQLLQNIVTSLAATKDNQRIVALELWLRSQYPGWTNTVYEAKIQMTWEMTDAILLLDNLDDFVTFK